MSTTEKIAYKVVCIDDSSPFEFQVLDDVNRSTLNEVCERIAENGKKFESLAVDLIKLMESALPFEVVREREFAPIKNKTGVDSVESAQELLRKNGVEL